MPAHIHAALMKQYYEDALETNKPWERWETGKDGYPWKGLSQHPDWDINNLYRRKRTPLCQVEDRDVFPGDNLWHSGRKEWVEIKGPSSAGCCIYAKGLGSVQTLFLSWSETPRTKTVYQWAHPSGKLWIVPTWFYETEKEFREIRGVAYDVPVRRLDWTALEVPA